MGRILTMAINDAERIIGNGGFETPITIIKDTVTTIVNGIAPVHHLSFDTDGNPVNSKSAHVTISEKSLISVDFMPRNTSGEISMKNILVSFPDCVGQVKTYIVKENYADETIGVIVLTLGNYAK